MGKMFSFILLLMVLGVHSIELTTSNYDELTKGKTTFVKFFAPWCGHCKSMKPAWDKINRKFGKTKEFLVIGEVDCTGKGKELCDANDVQGYPTLKYGNPQALEPYTGGRDGKSLRLFVETLTPLCSPENTDHCDDAGKLLIEKFMKLSPEELKTGIAEAEKKFLMQNNILPKKLKDCNQFLSNCKRTKKLLTRRLRPKDWLKCELLQSINTLLKKGMQQKRQRQKKKQRQRN